MSARGRAPYLVVATRGTDGIGPHLAGLRNADRVLRRGIVDLDLDVLARERDVHALRLLRIDHRETATAQRDLAAIGVLQRLEGVWVGVCRDDQVLGALRADRPVARQVADVDGALLGARELIERLAGARPVDRLPDGAGELFETLRRETDRADWRNGLDCGLLPGGRYSCGRLRAVRVRPARGSGGVGGARGRGGVVARVVDDGPGAGSAGDRDDEHEHDLDGPPPAVPCLRGRRTDRMGLGAVHDVPLSA